MEKQILERFKNCDSGLLCNHTSWNFGTGSYFFEHIPGLRRIFFPEHGLFSEYQDQESIKGKDLYRDFGLDVETVSLYGNNESTLETRPEQLEDIEILFIDLQDVGSRYFTYANTLGKMMKAIQKFSPNLKLVLIDRDNPAGLQVEGSQLPVNYSSFIGWTGLPHRHGLTLAELGLYFYKQLGANFPFFIQPLATETVCPDFSNIHPKTVYLLNNPSNFDSNLENHFINQSQFIPPSPNIPTQATAHVYPGQCLIEGTNLSEGRGTTRPFEQFGAPYLNPLKPLTDDDLFMRFPGAMLRPARFIPTFHKWKNEICRGFHLHLTGEPYHSLLHSLYIIRAISETYPNSFEWRDGVYEFGSDKKAIELLAGDSTLLDYLYGKSSFQAIKDYLQYSETNWLSTMNTFKIYDRRNYSILSQS